MGDPANLVESITPPVVTAIPAGEMQDAGKSLLSSKNGKKPDSGSSSSSSSFFTWFIVLALLGVWTSVAVVYFDLVDYQGVLGKLAAYDTDGDGDFDVEDAKVLLGLTSLGCGQGEAQVLDWLEEVEEGGSDWLNSFFTFLYTVINPLEPLEDEEDHGTSGVMNGQKENEEEEDEEEVRQRGAKDDGNKGQKIIIVGLHNQ
ncbi:aspartyl/asparaginyl beta-hydroxylase isoform X10 [Poecilia latipinna]|uniref:aspartyl/asparaginyl beta-hydroxylase isoform X10 n=1 Tax=Poecilia latipinna TaxID=48699 RepID=UPI00072EC0DE|nr:PREDICTED: aspartyl/asparaginyl beta-hydroxylase isoform X10 [Poecilia latipinna]